jgi:hypothetical protein
MLKSISNLGTVLNKTEQRSINGGYACFIYTFNDLVECMAHGGEIVYCAEDVECEAED